MSYVPIEWNELPSSDFSATPINAANLNHQELGILRTHAQSMSNAERDALTGADLFTGRFIWNTTVDRLEVYSEQLPGWFRFPIFVDVVQTSGDQTVNGNKTFNQPIIGANQFVGVRVHRTSDLNVQTSLQSIAWHAARFDTHAHWSAGNPGSIFAQKEGWYQVTCQVEHVSTLNGPFELEIRRNGTEVIAFSRTTPSQTVGFTQTHQIQDVMHLVVGDSVQVRVRAFNPNTEVLSGIEKSFLEMHRIGA